MCFESKYARKKRRNAQYIINIIYDYIWLLFIAYMRFWELVMLRSALFIVFRVIYEIFGREISICWDFCDVFRSRTVPKSTSWLLCSDFRDFLSQKVIKIDNQRKCSGKAWKNSNKSSEKVIKIFLGAWENWNWRKLGQILNQEQNLLLEK